MENNYRRFSEFDDNIEYSEEMTFDMLVKDAERVIDDLGFIISCKRIHLKEAMAMLPGKLLEAKSIRIILSEKGVEKMSEDTITKLMFGGKIKHPKQIENGIMA